MVECHPARSVMPKIQETTVWTETATGMMMAMTPMARSRNACWRSVPFHPRARVR